MAETAWAVLPPVITIVLALATKEVYMSLIIGIFSGAMLYANFNVLEAILTMFAVMEAKVGANVNILVFLVILGILVAAITRSGATKAYGDWAVRTIQGRRSALAITALLGIVIFIDDYFNCLTVGTVMRPVTDKFKIARTKLAYIIDATAAPVCILAPISSWAAAVGSRGQQHRRLRPLPADDSDQSLRMADAHFHVLPRVVGERFFRDGRLDPQE